MTKKKTVFKFLTVLQEEYESNWLSSMSREGWHLISYSPFIYTFEKGEPKEYTYKFDYQTEIQDKELYISIFEEAGWEFILTYLGWQFFRCEPDNVKIPELFTDAETRIEKYMKLIRFLGSVFIMLLILSVTIIFNPIMNRVSYMWILKIIYGCMILIYSFLLYGLYNRIQEIKKRNS